MEVSVCILNDRIEIVIGSGSKSRAKIKKVYSLAALEGTVMNGIIIGEQHLREMLEQIWNRFRLPRHGICVVIDSGKIMTKVLEVPFMKDWELVACMDREFADGEKKDLVTDYFPFPKTDPYAMNRIFCAAVEKSVIESYLTLFQSLKLRVRRVSIGLGCLLKAIMVTGMVAGQTCVFMLIKGTITVSVLFENGEYIYSRRNRMISDPKSAEWMEELGQIADGIRQFYRQRHSSYILDSLYIAGCSEAVVKEIDAYMQVYGIQAKIPKRPEGVSFAAMGISEAKEMPADPFSYIYGIGNLFK